MSIGFRASMVGLLLCLCGSCQTGSFCEPELSSKLAWEDYSTAPLITGVRAHYWNDAHQYWVVLCYEGQGYQCHVDEIVLLCLKKEQLEGCCPRYQLKGGLAVQTTFLRTKGPAHIVVLRLLKDEFFRGDACEMTFFYNGMVSGSSKTSVYHDDGTHMNWLRFEVVPKKNKEKVISAVKKLYPLLKEEPDASDVLACLAPLISEVDGGT